MIADTVLFFDFNEVFQLKYKNREKYSADFIQSLALLCGSFLVIPHSHATVPKVILSTIGNMSSFSLDYSVKMC